MASSKYFKHYKNGKFAYCSNCGKLMKRIYKRVYYVWTPIGWECEICKILCYD